MSLEEAAEGTTNRQEFERFLEMLASDFRDNRGEWDNAKLEEFLAGLAHFARDMDGYFANRGQNIDTSSPSWALFAQMLVAATVYE